MMSAWFRWLCAAVLLTAVLLPPASAQPSFTEVAGTFPDGTPYRMRMPPAWNGVLINDLDYALAADNARNLYFLEKGYAVSGTARNPLRRYRYDPAVEVGQLVEVMDMFAARFGKPRRVLQYGHSGGGHVALAMGELRPDRVDGVIAGCAHTPVWLMNTMLDGWFVAKALLAPDLPVVDLPDNHAAITAAWRTAINAAQQTPQGRARIALAITLGQWPAWQSATTPKPDPKNAQELQQSMYETLFAAAAQPGGQSRFMFELPGGQLSWNDGVDYKKFLGNANEFYRQAVHELYAQAGLDLQADLQTLGTFPRVNVADSALHFWAQPGRTVHGMPKVPVLRIHTVGDIAVPVHIVQGYDAAVRANGRNELYRTAYVDRAGHCTFSVSDSAAAVETVMRRLDTGKWLNSTTSTELNALGNALHSSGARYLPFNPEKYNRAWFPAQ